MRLFVAALLSSEVLAELARVQKLFSEAIDSGLRLTSADQLHVTLKFLGDVDETLVSLLTSELQEIASSVEPFEVSLSNCGVFPPRGAPRILWAGLEDSGQHLKTLAQRIDSSFEPLGFAREEREFHPHITIGRMRDDVSHSALTKALETITPKAQCSTIRSIELISSELTRRGPIHTKAAQVRLGQA